MKPVKTHLGVTLRALGLFIRRRLPMHEAIIQTAKMSGNRKTAKAWRIIGKAG